MQKKKIFGIGAVVIMILTALMPAVSSIDMNTSSVTSDYEIVSTACIFDKYEYEYVQEYGMLCTFAIYTLQYTLLVPDELIEENIDIIFETNASLTRYLKVKPTSTFYTGTKEIVLNLDSPLPESELDIAAQDYTLSITENDASCEGFVVYWKEDDKTYAPSDTHMQLTGPHEEGWMFDGYTAVQINGTVFQYPEWDDVYTYHALPTVVASDYLGWIGDVIDRFLNVTKAFLKFTAEFAEALAIAVVIIGEITLLFEEVTAFFAKLSVGIPPTDEISDFLKLLALLAGTLIKFLESIQDLPIDPNDPERIALSESIIEFKTYVLEEHWCDDIEIAGGVSQCENGEIVNLKCSTLDENIPGGAGQRTFEYILESDWAENGPYIFRDCQMTITGNIHPKQMHKSLQKLSYVAPGGRLYCQFGFKEKSRGRADILIEFFKEFFSKHPNMFPVLQQLLKL